MKIATRKVYDVLVVDMSGRLDSHSSGDAGDRIVEIAQGEDKRVLLNLEQLEFVSSAGLRVILRGAKLLEGHHGDDELQHVEIERFGREVEQWVQSNPRCSACGQLISAELITDGGHHHE